MIGVGVIGIVGIIDLGVTEIPMSYIDPPSTNGSHGCASIAYPTMCNRGAGRSRPRRNRPICDRV